MTNWIKLFKTQVRHCCLSLLIKGLGGHFFFTSENGLRFIYIKKSLILKENWFSGWFHLKCRDDMKNCV